MISDATMPQYHGFIGFDICFWAAALLVFVQGVHCIMNHFSRSVAPMQPPASGPINDTANTGNSHQGIRTYPNPAITPTLPQEDGSNHHPSEACIVSGAPAASTMRVRTHPHATVTLTQLQTMRTRTHPGSVVAPTRVNAGPSNKHQPSPTRKLSARENRKRKREEQEAKDLKSRKIQEWLRPWF
jgi:hypothetical protein